LRKLALVLTAAATLALPATALARGTTSLDPVGICIDPGHGGSDSGASHAATIDTDGTTHPQINEKDLNLSVALKLRDKLTQAGYHPILTRTNDTYYDNGPRYDYCNSTPTSGTQLASIVVSIHHNGSTSTTADYGSALWAGNDDKALAQTIGTSVNTALNDPLTAPPFNLTYNGTSRFMSGVLLKTNVPAIISESFFITADREYNLVRDCKVTGLDSTNSASYNLSCPRLDTEVNGLYNGIDAYLPTNPTPPSP
jgi:N-acetylmuramoyl-L-alanine amidase